MSEYMTESVDFENHTVCSLGFFCLFFVVVVVVVVVVLGGVRGGGKLTLSEKKKKPSWRDPTVCLFVF